MSKELEALNYLYNNLRLMKCLDIVEEAKIKSAYGCLLQSLQHLEAIDNAKPSEVLEKLEMLSDCAYEISARILNKAIKCIKKNILYDIEKDKMIFVNKIMYLQDEGLCIKGYATSYRIIDYGITWKEPQKIITIKGEK